METAIRKDLKAFLGSWPRNNDAEKEHEASDMGDTFIIRFSEFMLEIDIPNCQFEDKAIIKVFKQPERKVKYIGIENEYKIVRVLEETEPDMDKIIEQLYRA